MIKVGYLCEFIIVSLMLARNVQHLLLFKMEKKRNNRHRRWFKHKIFNIFIEWKD